MMNNQDQNTTLKKETCFLKDFLTKFFSIIYLAILSEAICDFLMLIFNQLFIGVHQIYITNHGAQRYTPTWHLILGIIISIIICLIYKISIPKLLNIKSVSFIDYILTGTVIYRIGFYIYWLTIINTRY